MGYYGECGVKDDGWMSQCNALTNYALDQPEFLDQESFPVLSLIVHIQ